MPRKTLKTERVAGKVHPMKAKIAVLASGDGSNFESIVQAAHLGHLPAEIVGLVVSRDGVEAVRRAGRLKIPVVVLNPKNFADRGAWDVALRDQLVAWNADWVALAGFLALIGPAVLKKFSHRLINSHPALLPKFGGPGMYGHNVHQAVIAAGEVETGVTFHLVDEVYDHGRVLVQEKIPVLANDTAESLATRLKARENELYPRVLADLVTGRITTG